MMTALIECDQFAVNGSSQWQSFLESSADLRKPLGEVFPVFRLQMNATFVPYSLCSEAVKLQFVNPTGTIWKAGDRQTLHGRGKRNVAISSSRHSKSDSVGLASFSLRSSTKLA